MPKNFDSSSYINRVKAKAVASYNYSITNARNSGSNVLFPRQNANSMASLDTDIAVGNLYFSNSQSANINLVKK